MAQLVCRAPWHSGPRAAPLLVFFKRWSATLPSCLPLPCSLASGGGDTLKCHIKQYGRFTRGLLRALRHRRPLAVRLSGPMGSEVTASGCQLAPPPSWCRYDAVVMVAGGVGVTAMLGMLRAMLEAHRAAEAGRGPSEGLPGSVVCIWTARQAGEFLSLDSSLLAAARWAGGAGATRALWSGPYRVAL